MIQLPDGATRARSGRMAALLVPVLMAAACGSDPQDPGDGNEDPMGVTSLSFLTGSWNVSSRYVAADGTVEETSAVSRIQSSIGGKVMKETLQGVRGGQPFEVQTLFVSRSSGVWALARADGRALTFDVLEGSLTSSTASASFTSRTGTRPDAGRDRVRLTDVTQDSFTWVAERSADMGATWTEFWRMDFERTASVTLAPSDASCDDAAYHEFDFWLGDWNATGGGTNDIRSRLDGCILEENWIGGSTGTSYNMRDSRTGLWYQVWGDSFNYVFIGTGGLQGEQMIIEGDAGGAQRVRITWTPFPDGRVRQLGEVSGNGGASWQVSYDLTYSLK